MQQTTVVAVFAERAPTFVGWFNGTPRMIVDSHFGSIYPPPGTAAGRVFLAFLPAAETRPSLMAKLQSERDVQQPGQCSKSRVCGDGADLRFMRPS